MKEESTGFPVDAEKPSGDQKLFESTFTELHRLARRQMAGQRRSHTLQATALVNEAYLKIEQANGGEPLDRSHFVRLAGRAMRQVLVDHARRKEARSFRHGAERVDLDLLAEDYERSSGGLLALDAALLRLQDEDPELVRLVELRFFAGQCVAEVATALGMSERSVARRWDVARAILRRELER